ncbi:MAG: S53 family peptidase [Parcubacteria group bacterium]|nr:S53 family peptidase [Parcubacteria group bacterium]
MNTNKKLLLILFLASMAPYGVHGAYRFSDFKAKSPIHVYKSAQTSPSGITPDQIKTLYHLPKTGEEGTIAIIAAYDDPTIEKDLNIFNKAFNLPSCTTQNNCFEKHKMTKSIKTDGGWSLETSLDVEWAHAIAPKARILLVEATTPSGKNLLDAIDYARARPDIVAVSMSWGGSEFKDETDLDSHFTSLHRIAFFASSGDNGWGASWPASSPNVIGVGGTSLKLNTDGSLASETAWSGSGGGVSKYENQPSYQKDYTIPKSKGKRAIPDVSYNADPKSGFPVYKSSTSKGNWYVVGGTSAGAPQWAAIQSLGLSASLENFYKDKASDNYASFFRDIVSGKNGSCTYYCEARKHYDYVTGLGSPQTVHF